MEITYINEELSRVWPDWTVDRLIGRGSFGTVYEIHRGSGIYEEKAALKILRVTKDMTGADRLRPGGTNGEDPQKYFDQYIDSFRKEIVLMQRLMGNSHIVSYEDYSIRRYKNAPGGNIYIRMELLTSLTEYLETHAADDRLILKIGMDIAEGLRDCHKEGIIHRDVKPQNIFVNKAGSFKLGDFGVSRYVPASFDTLSFKGTVSYMAPEVFYFKGTDERSDLYSLGMVLYLCLNDYRLPFLPVDYKPDDVEKAKQLRLSGRPVPDPAHGSAGLKKAIRKALEADPADRYQSAGEMYQALEKIYKNGQETDKAVFLDGAGSFYSDEDDDTGFYKKEYDIKDPTETFAAASYAKSKKKITARLKRDDFDADRFSGFYAESPHVYEEEQIKEKASLKNGMVQSANNRVIIGLLLVCTVLLGLSGFWLWVKIHSPSEEGGKGKQDTWNLDAAGIQDIFIWDGHTYALVNAGDVNVTDTDSMLSWCRDQGGYAATISSDNELVLLYNRLLRDGINDACFGLTSDGTGWYWAGPEESDFTRWGRGAPGGNRINGCAHFDGKVQDGSWQAGTISSDSRFLCEWEDIRGEYEEAGVVPLISSTSYTYYDHVFAILDMSNYGIDQIDEKNTDDDYLGYRALNQFCEVRGGHLAVIHDQEENDFLYSKVKELGAQSAFFGYSDEKSEGSWEWVTGNSSYTNWSPRQPSQSSVSEDYAQFNKKLTDGTWNDAPFAENTRLFIIEWDNQK